MERVVAVLINAELDVAAAVPRNLKVAIVHEEHGRAVVAVVHRTGALDLDVAAERGRARRF